MHSTYSNLFLVYIFSIIGPQNIQPAKEFPSLPHPASRTISYFRPNKGNATYSLARTLPKIASKIGRITRLSKESKTTLAEIAEISCPAEREAAFIEMLEGLSETERTQLTQELSAVLDEVAAEGVEMAENPPKRIKNPRNRIERRAKYGSNWQEGSLQEAIDKFAPRAKGVPNDSGKIIYRNHKTGIQVVYDKKGDYFRIENTNHVGKRRYLDLEGNTPNNKTIKGKISGRNKQEYKQVTHFKNTDKK